MLNRKLPISINVADAGLSQLQRPRAQTHWHIRD